MPLQNLVPYSVNRADNIMLGNCSQMSLSAATVNHVFFMVQQFALSIGNALMALVIQSDQIFKGLPIFLRFRKYQWMKK